MPFFVTFLGTQKSKYTAERRNVFGKQKENKALVGGGVQLCTIP